MRTRSEVERRKSPDLEVDSRIDSLIYVMQILVFFHAEPLTYFTISMSGVVLIYQSLPFLEASKAYKHA